MSKIKIFGMGGLDENGKNTYIVEVDNKIFIFDAGLKYASDSNFGIDYIIPDYKYLVDNRKRIVGVFVTHAHPESYGGVSDLIKNIPEIKVYGLKYTILIIAHRLSTVINSDKIYVINKGTVEGVGTHKELLKTCKTYADLYKNEDNKSK